MLRVSNRTAMSAEKAFLDSPRTLQTWYGQMATLNDWKVPYSTITFFERVLKSHKKVESYTRDKDILFTILRHPPLSAIQVLLVNEYTLGLAAVMRALTEFPGLNCIVTGGEWNAYTREAKQYGLDQEIGIYGISDFLGALNLQRIHTYVKKDKERKSDQSLPPSLKAGVYTSSVRHCAHSNRRILICCASTTRKGSFHRQHMIR